MSNRSKFMLLIVVSTATFALVAKAPRACAAEKLKILIVDGQNNHNWKAMTPYMSRVLEETGRFEVDVATTPAKNAAEKDWEQFRPDFAQYDAVLSNYNGEPWPEQVQQDLVKYVRGGGGLVIIHAANNAFPQWREWNEMIGLGWRGKDYGDRIIFDKQGKQVRIAAGEGANLGHGSRHDFAIVVRDSEHPITRGLPREWMHAKDELYHGQRGPALNMQILATAYSDKSTGGTGEHEPMIWVIPYGKGRVFTTVMGHVSGDDIIALRCYGFHAVMNRGTEWAATGKVTLPVPENFPKPDKVNVDRKQK